MSDPVQALFQVGLLRSTAFPPNSRYHSTDTATHSRADGTVVVYLRRRIVPPPERFALIRQYTVREGDRLDRVAAKEIGDPELFWLICDANGAIRPNELMDTVGRRIRITLPEGVPGPGQG